MIEGNIVEIKSLCKKFNNDFILHDLNLHLKKQESICILGESGMGKSVLMKIIGMLLEATSGSVKINGTEIVGINSTGKASIMSKIGFLFQHSALFDELSVLENIAFKEIFVDKMPKVQAQNIVLSLLHELGIKDHVVYLKPNQLSGGMQRRIGIARTLIKKPQLILFDEPTSGLDPIMSEKINEIIIKTNKQFNASIVTITHDLSSALRISNRIYVLNKQKIIWHGNSQDIFQCEDEYIKQFIKSSNIKIC